MTNGVGRVHRISSVGLERVSQKRQREMTVLQVGEQGRCPRGRSQHGLQSIGYVDTEEAVAELIRELFRHPSKQAFTERAKTHPLLRPNPVEGELDLSIRYHL